MQALVYHLSLPKVLLARLLAARRPGLVTGPGSPLQLTQMPAPELRGADWAVLATRLAGICGTDLGLLMGQSSPSASPFNSFPAVLGHEVVATIQEAGSRVPYPPGTRVVVDPGISCTMRGLDPPCPSCRAGFPYLCRRCTEGELAPGIIIGFNRDLPGGWGQMLAAHESQLFPVPEELSDERAVLVEPLAVAVHAVLRRRPEPGERVLVIGAGTIGLCTVAALRLLDVDCHITLVARYPFQAELGRSLGADQVIDGRGDGLLQAAAGLPWSGLHKPIMGRPVLRGGFDIVYDCVGSRSSLDDALRVTAEGGALVLVGGAGEVGALDWTFVWLRELSIIGSVGYGNERLGDETVHTFRLTMDRLAAMPDLPVERMITHRYPLADYRSALAAALGRRSSRAIKVIFDYR